MSRDTMQPVFIVGAARSGTTALVSGLIQGANLPGYYEGHVLPLLNQLHQTVDTYFAALDKRILAVKEKQLIGWLDAEALKEHIVLKFSQVIEERLGSGAWVDKTPGSQMIQAIPRLTAIFPNARVVFARRRGIENVLSRTVKFPGHPFEAQCTFWAQCMQAWLDARSMLTTEKYMEVDLHDIALHPEETAKNLGAFLGFSKEQIDSIVRLWHTERPQQARTAQDYRYVGLEETAWSREDKDTFMRVCGPMMEKYGYAMDGQVFPEAYERPVYLFYPVAGIVEKEVQVRNVMKNGFLPFGQGFLLHPNGPGAAQAEVRYRGLEFFGHNEFEATLFVESLEAKPVEFRLSVKPTGGEVSVFESSTQVVAGQKNQWALPLPALQGTYDVAVSTVMATDTDSNHKARAAWTRPRFVKTKTPEGIA